MLAILMMSAKFVTLGLFKIKIFWNKGFDVIISAHDIANNILSRDWNCIVDMVIQPKFGNSKFLWGKLSSPNL